MTELITADQIARVKAVFDDRDNKYILIESLQSPEELECLYENWCWDDGATGDVMTRIIRHPLCDKGTALHMFWFCSLPYLLESASADERPDLRDIYELTMELMERYSSGQFQSERFRFVPETSWVITLNLKHEIPPELFLPTMGEDVIGRFPGMGHYGSDE